MLALDQNIWFGIAGLLLGVLFALSVVWVRRKQQRTEIELAENAAARIIEEAKRDAGGGSYPLFDDRDEHAKKRATFRGGLRARTNGDRT